jgi:anti-anti-sigma regulatory factor
MKRPSVRSRRPSSRRAETLTLGAALTINEVGACRQALRKLLLAGGARGEAAVHAQSLRAIDTAGLQLLLAAGQAAQQRGCRLALLGATDLLQAAATALGLHAALGAALELRP